MASRSKNNDSQQSILNRVQNTNRELNELLRDESRGLGMPDGTRAEELVRLHSKYNRAVRTGGQNIYDAKSAGQSTYSYIVNSILGNRTNHYGNGNFQMDTGNTKRNEWLDRSRLEKLFTSGDSQVMSYFMSTNSSIVHVYDEIDSVCSYMYQLDEAILCIRDNIVTSEEVSAAISMDISFPNISSDTDTAEYVDAVRDAFKYQDFQKKLIDHIVPKGVRYGRYYVMIIPYSEIGIKLYQLTGGGQSMQIAGLQTTRPMFESTSSTTDDVAVLDSIKENIVSLYESVYLDNRQSELPSGPKRRLNNILENLNQIYICEDTTPPNVATNLSFKSLQSLDGDVQRLVNTALTERLKKEQVKIKSPSSKGTTTSSDGVVDPSKMDQISGCYLKLVDPREMYPIKIFDFTLGYYYFEGYDYNKEGVTLTDLLSNDMNFDNNSMMMDNIVNSVLSNLKYAELVEGDAQLRTMVLNCLLYAEKRNSPVRVKFVPVDYVVPFETNTDANGNGQPVLTKSLFYARLYTSLLLFNITAIVTKSTDSEYYYLKESALDPQYSNQVSDLMDQLQDANIDPIQIANGNILHGNRAINKRYFMSVGTSDVRPIDIETVSGQSIDIHNDFLTDLRKMAIGSTGVPSVMTDFMDEVEYATMLGMANIKHLKRCNSISSDYDGAITEVIKKILKYNNTFIPDNVLSELQITLKKSKNINNNITNQQITDVVSIADTMVNTFLMGQDSQATDLQPFIAEELKKDLIMDLTNSAPWGNLSANYDRAVIRAKARKLKVDAAGNTGGE